MRQLQHNFVRLQAEKEATEEYCQDMESTVSSKEAMLEHIKEQNSLLTRKLNRRRCPTARPSPSGIKLV